MLNAAIQELRRPILTLGVLFAFLLSHPVALAATYYVAQTGSDSNAGTQSLPFRQIRRGVSAAVAGDTILVGDGSYLGFDVIGKSGTSASRITLRAIGNAAQVFPTTDRPDNRDTIFLSNSSHWTIEGLRSFNANRAAVRLDYSHHVTIRNCVFGNNTTWGIFTDHSNDSLFEYNECYGSINQHGIYVSNSIERPTIRGNRLHSNRQCGLHMNGDLNYGAPGLVRGALVENNIIWNNGPGGGAGINMDGPQDSVVRNNLIFGNVAGGITAYAIDAAEGPRNLQILNNTIDMPSNGRWALLIKQSAGLVTVRNNILYHANSARGGILFGNSTDVSNTDSNYNVIDRFTPNDGAAVYTLAQWQNMGRELNSRSALPSALFVNPSAADYHLRSNSPAIDTGTTVAVPHDNEGDSRPSGGGYDIGADEVVSSAPSPPVISALSPASATAGAAAFSLTVTGTGFVSGAVVKWNGSTRSTTVDSATQVRASITAADVAAAGTATIRVANPGSADSNSLTFTVNAPANYSLSATPTSVAPGGAISVAFTAPSGSSSTDWIGMYRVGAGDSGYVAYRYTSGAASGTLTFTAPTEPGDYEFRYFLNNGYTRRATSNTVTVTGAAYCLTASPSSAAPGATLTVSWTAPAGRPANDWIGLFRAGAADAAYVAWRYTGGTATGSMTFTAPNEAGDYEFRYFINGGFVKMATSNRVSIGAASTYTLSATPATVAPGGALTVAWTAAGDRTATDWIGLYRVGSADSAYLWWSYTNGAATGSFNVTAPNMAGEYEFRYFKQNGWQKLATSNRVTVGTLTYSLTATPATVAPGGTITVTWTAPSGSSATDWIGFFRVGAFDSAYLAYRYTNGATSGSATFTAPAATGQYEFRYYVNNTSNRKAVSNTVTVQ